MPIAYIDANRGNDTTGDGSILKPFRSISKANNWNAGAGGGILLARDSIFEINSTLAASGALSLSSAFNGVYGNRAFIDAYDPPGVGSLTTKPTIQMRMIPSASDWIWDSTLNFGVPRGWYLQFTRGTGFWDVRVKANGIYAETTNQDTTNNTGLGYINGQQNGAHAGSFVNGMSYDTFRFNFDISNSSAARLYLAGQGLNSPLKNPTQVLGVIEIAFGTAISMFDAGQHCIIQNIRTELGAGLLTYQGTANTIREMLEITNCESFDTCCQIRINAGTSSASGNKWKFNIHNNEHNVLTGPAFTAFGGGISGEYHNNKFSNGNIASSMGGGIYSQIDQSTVGGVADPFVYHHNTADTWRNGAGNNEFDGGCYYADVNDNGSIFNANIAKNSFVSFQCGSGKKSEWFNNVSINCEQFVMMNNAPYIDLSDYTFVHNVFKAAARGTYSHGDTADVHKFHAPLYHVGDEADFIGIRFANNVMINHQSNINEIPLNLCADAQWASGKALCKNNLFIGYGAKLVTADFGAINKTSSSSSLPVNTDPKFASIQNNIFSLKLDSPLVGAGYGNFTNTDAASIWRGSPPSVGAYELTKSQFFSL